MWSKREAEEIENHLRTILGQIPGVVNIEGRSLRDRDYKVHFELNGLDNFGYLLSYSPSQMEFEGWCVGLGYAFPKHIVGPMLKLLFHKIVYVQKPSSKRRDGIHLWRSVGLEQLRKAVANL